MGFWNLKLKVFIEAVFVVNLFQIFLTDSGFFVAIFGNNLLSVLEMLTVGFELIL